MRYIGPPTAVVGITSSPLITAGTYLEVIRIQTLPSSTSNVWLRADGTDSVVQTGILVALGGGFVVFGREGLPIPTANITAVTDGDTPQTVLLAGS